MMKRNRVKEETQSMVYELINPSDKIFFDAPDQLTAALAVAYLSTLFGARTTDKEDSDVPVLLGDAEKWFDEVLGISSDEELARVITERKLDVAEALSSFRLEGEGTSCFDICGYAHSSAKHLLV